MLIDRVILLMNKQKSWGGSTKSASFYNQSLSKYNPSFLPCKEADFKELSFLKHKNRQLQQSTFRLAHYIIQLQKEKEDLIKLNSRYVQTLNRQFKSRHIEFDREVKKQKKSGQGLCKHCNKAILVQFQKDYRNLVKHCAVLEEQIVSKNQGITEYQDIKRRLRQTKHDSIEQLVAQLTKTAASLVELKKHNNYVQFESQKLKRQAERLTKNSLLEKNQLSLLQAENQNYKCLINTIQNECMDKQNKYKARVYELEVTLQKLEKQLRGIQQESRQLKVSNQEMRSKQIDRFQADNKVGMISSRSGATSNRPTIHMSAKID